LELLAALVTAAADPSSALQLVAKRSGFGFGFWSPSTAHSSSSWSCSQRFGFCFGFCSISTQLILQLFELLSKVWFLVLVFFAPLVQLILQLLLLLLPKDL
jgi:hypothetical protein